ncbi:MAG: type III pantothenate kinase [Bacillota bacterium]|jgi:type III pantothenate kinase|nr:type III pantothenate kinase [Bacillota bacterium]MDI9415178.1 type III pantothenate kinase [Bacillota bacterium]NLD12343.1 type III pantothenate kinase [Bacillota bacterium]HAV20936.1 type III pantothenate kinase [Bacillota bacterium]HOB88773.1 type III pantothenate kinase [Bacillota bacterium]
MLLALDIGNTHIMVGVYNEAELVTCYRISTDRHKTSDEYAMVLHALLSYDDIEFSEVSGIAMSCVVPPLTVIFEELSKRYFKIEPLIVEPGIKTGMVLRYENPREIGADRIVNAVAAYEKYRSSVIIVDFGTATTFCAVSEDGEYLGGVICPGIMISSEALFSRAARLPRVELVRPPTVIGRNTVRSMQSGLIYGAVGQVNEIVRRIKDEMGTDPKVIATGGLAPLIAEEAEEIDDIDVNLTLEGLRIIYERNNS